MRNLLRIDPAARAGARMTLTGLPAGDVPGGDGIRDMALSPDGAAEIGNSLGYAEELNVFDLATGPNGPGAPAPAPTACPTAAACPGLA
jgi:hypothetical protein